LGNKTVTLLAKTITLILKAVTLLPKAVMLLLKTVKLHGHAPHTAALEAEILAMQSY
jgi:hypothetical protein